MLYKAETQAEEKLVEAAAGGDFLAFEKLVELYTRPIWSYVFRLLGNAEDANDTVQQILMQLYQSLPALENPARFRPWLFTIARHKCLDQLRRRPHLSFADFENFSDNISANNEDEEAGLSACIADQNPLPQEIIERRETQQLLLEAIATLPERARHIVTLRYATDLTFAEIGETLDINENTVKTLFGRAKAQLRLYLKQRL